MYKYTDLLRQDEVAPIWFNTFLQLFDAILIDLANERNISVEELMTFDTTSKYAIAPMKNNGLVIDAQKILGRVTATTMMNKEYQKALINNRRNYMNWDEDKLFPIQYDISEYMSEVSTTTIGDHPQLVKLSNKLSDLLVEAIDNKTINMNEYLAGDKANDLVDSMNKSVMEHLLENKLYFARPPYDHVWCYLGSVDDNDERCEQSVKIEVFTYDEWTDSVTFDNPHTLSRKFVLENEKEYVINFKTYSRNILGMGAWLESDAYIRMDENHSPVDYHQALADTDIYLDLVTKAIGFYEKYSETDVDTSASHINKILQNGFENIYLEYNLGANRTYLLFELFSLMNMKSNDLPKDETVIQSVRKDSNNSSVKKMQKRMKKKGYGEVDEEFLILKTLKINPLLDTDSVGGVTRSFSFTQLREHKRAGHTKTYTEDRPRFGKAHKNNIGTFWYPPTTVKKDSRKGKVTKDYSVEI